MLSGKKILLGITASISAYKSINLLRLFKQQNADVKVILTPEAKNFVPPLVLDTLSNNDVHSNLIEKDKWVNHIELSRWADILVIAPLSCNTLAKMVCGICDNLLLAVYMSARCKVFVAPAMDEDMLLHKITQENINQVKLMGIEVIPTSFGYLSSGLIGQGRMMEPEKILEFINNKISYKSKQQQIDFYRNKNILVSAGGTVEDIDPVRFIGNKSSGKMGIAIANLADNLGAKVILIKANTHPDIKINSTIKIINVSNAKEMLDKCLQYFKDTDICFMSAAISDFTVKKYSKEKIKKHSENIILELVKTKDVLLELGKIKSKKQFLVGFALETNDGENNALKKLYEKNCNLIILNNHSENNSVMGSDVNKITLFYENKDRVKFPSKTKVNLAEDILNNIASRLSLVNSNDKI